MMENNISNMLIDGVSQKQNLNYHIVCFHQEVWEQMMKGNQSCVFVIEIDARSFFNIANQVLISSQRNLP